METRGLVACVLVIEEEKEAGKPLVDVLRGEIHAVVVVPKGTQVFSLISVGWIRAVETRKKTGIVLIVVLPSLEEIAGETITFRRCMRVVQVGRYRWKPEAPVLANRRQVVEVSHQERMPVVCLVRGPWD